MRSYILCATTRWNRLLKRASYMIHTFFATQNRRVYDIIKICTSLILQTLIFDPDGH